LQIELVRVAALDASVSIDVRSVERVDTATLQLLYAFVRDRSQRGLGVKWLGCPPAFLDAARMLGVHGLLALPEAGAA
jgi:ABC-type transporter Mla MlaB component